MPDTFEPLGDTSHAVRQQATHHEPHTYRPRLRPGESVRVETIMGRPRADEPDDEDAV